MPNKKIKNNTLSLLQTTLPPFFKQGLLVLFTSLTMVFVGCEDNSTEPKSAEKEITSFKFEATKNTALAADADGTISGNNITVTLPAGTSRSALTPTIDYKGESIDPTSGVVQDFSSPVTYTVTAEDGTTQAYTVTVTAPNLSSSKDITVFGFKATPNNALSADVDGTISGTAIALTVPEGTDVSALIPEIAHSGMSIALQSGVAQNFSQTVTYTVTAQDNSTKEYVVTVQTPSSKDMTMFGFKATPNNALSADVDGAISGTTITLTVPEGTDVTALIPEISYLGMSIDPQSGTAQNFSQPVTYTVTAQDNSTKEYVVTVQTPSSKDMTMFGFKATPNNALSADVDGTISGTTITLTVPEGTDVSALIPEIAHSGMSIAPQSGVVQDFSQTVNYTVTAEDNSTKQYVVTVVVRSASSKEMTVFDFKNTPNNALDTDVVGTISGLAITLTVPAGTDITALIPEIAHSGMSIAPQSGVAQNFSQTVTYTVTAQDNSTKEYVVTVQTPSSKDITMFGFKATPNDALSADVDGTISGTAIALTVPAGTDVTALIPDISYLGMSIAPQSGVVQNFSQNVTYTVTAEDNSTKEYVVTVTVQTSSSKDIAMFGFKATPNNALSADVDGTISGTAIALAVPAGTNVTALIPDIYHSGKSIAPQNGAVQNFTNPVNYTVTAEDNSTQQYVVTVTIQASTTKDISMFGFKATSNNALSADVDGTISGTAIALTVPAGTNVTALISEISHSGMSIAPQSGVAQNFSQPVTYTVTAEDNSTQQYVVTVTIQASTTKDIDMFGFKATPNNALSADVDGTISGTAIALAVPAGTNVTALIPDISHSGQRIAPQNGAVQNFSQPVTYTVTAEDNSTKQYVVTVTIQASTTKNIDMFGFKATPNDALSADVDGTISGTAIALTVPAGTNVTALIPDISHSGQRIEPQNGVAQNFNQPVTYAVTAEDNSTKQYVVTVTKLASPSNAIAVVAYTGSTNLGPAVTDDIFEAADAIATISNISQNGSATIIIRSGSGASASTRTINNVTVANNAATIPKSELAAAVAQSASLALRVSINQGAFTSNEVTLTYNRNNIYSWQDLQAMRQRLTDDYTLINDITFPEKGVNGFPAAGFEPVGQFIDDNNDMVNDDPATAFQGSFDGGGHTISNFSIARSGSDYVGLFGFAQSPAMASTPKRIHDLVISQSGIEGSDDSRAGTLAGQLINMIVDGVGAESTANRGVLKGSIMGGLVGFIQGCQVNGYAKINIERKTNLIVAGGLIGMVSSSANAASVVNGYATGNINMPSSQTFNSNLLLLTLGGLVGAIQESTATYPVIVRGYATGNIDVFVGGSASRTSIGGLVGTASSYYSIRGYSRGDLTKTGSGSNGIALFSINFSNVSTSTSIGYHSGSATESRISGTTPSDDNNFYDGTPVTVTAATTTMDFSALTFGSAVGEWTFNPGRWPAINLSSRANGAFSINDQPTAP